MGASRPAEARPELPRAWTPVQRFHVDRQGEYRFRPSRPTFTVSGAARRAFAASTPPPALTPAALLSSGYPAPRSVHPLFNRTRQRYGECTSPGVPPPYSARQSLAPVCPGRFHSSRHRPSSGFHTPSTVCFARNPTGLVSSPLRSWGFTGSGDSLASFDAGRADAPGLPLQGSPSPRDRHLVGGAPLSRFVGSGGGDAHASPSAEDRMRGLTPVTEPTGTTESSITKGSAFPTVANRKRRPS